MSITLSALQQQRRDTAANWTSANPTLLAGEIGVETDTGLLKIGDGSTAWTSLDYLPLSFEGYAANNIYNPAANQVALATNGTERMRIDGSGRLLVATSSNTNVGASVGAKIQTRFSGSHVAISAVRESSAPIIALGRVEGTGSEIVANGDKIGELRFAAADGTDLVSQAAAIYCEIDGTPGADDMPGRIVFATTDAGDNAPTERMRIRNNGNVGINEASPDHELHIKGADPVIMIESNGSYGDASGIIFRGKDSGGTARNMAKVAGVGTGSNIGALTFSSRVSGALTEAMRIDSSGRVGVGISAPVVPVDIHSAANGLPATTGTTQTHGSLRINSSQTTGCIDMGPNSSNPWIQATDRTDLSQTYNLLLNPNGGNVGIGTASASTKLVIAGNNNGSTNNNTLRFVDTDTSSSATQQSGRIEFFTSDSNQSGVHSYIAGQTFSTTGIGGLVFGTGTAGSSTEKMRINNAGNVGIGTTNPTEKLQVTDGTNSNFYIAPGYNSDAGTLLGVGGSEYISFATNGLANERMRIDSNGRLLIGASSARSNFNNTTTNYTQLQVEGANNNTSSIGIIQNYDADTLGARLVLAKNNSQTIGSNVLVDDGDRLGGVSFQGNDATNFVEGALIAAEVDGTAAANDMPTRLAFYTNSGAAVVTERMRIESTGASKFEGTIAPKTDDTHNCGGSSLRWSAVYAVNGTIQTSDERQKTNIENSSLGGDFVKALRPVSYKWIEGGKSEIGVDEHGQAQFASRPGQRTHWGFIAQEVKQAVDAAGVDFGGWVLTDKDNPDSQQALRYDQFIAPLTKALQEAIAKIETLESKVAALEAAN